MPKLIMTIDPNKKFTDAKVGRLIGALGIIPIWIEQGISKGLSIQNAIIAEYPYYMGPLEGVTIRHDGSYHSPGDPIHYPIALIETDTEKGYIYLNSRVGVVNKETDEQWFAVID